MGSLSITLAIVLCAWVYAALHPVNIHLQKEPGGAIVAVITLALTISAIITGILSAFGLG